MRRTSDQAYLHTVTLDELIDNVLEEKSVVDDNLLYTGSAAAPEQGAGKLGFGAWLCGK